MLDYIGDVPNPHAKDYNPEIIIGAQDRSFAEYAIIAMRELEAVENIKIEKIRHITNQDEIDLNNHMVNINFKKKDMSSIEIPKHKHIAQSRVEELVFTVRVSTNLNEKVIEKRILLPDRVDGMLLNNGKKMKDVWQLVDASTYSQRGKITLKSRMPIIIYHNKRRLIDDVLNNTFTMPSYSYALETMMKKPGSKKKVKFINPLLLYCTKMGYSMARSFFGMDDIVYLAADYSEKELDDFYIFPVDEIFCKVKKHYYDTYELVKSFVCMVCNLRSRDFPVDFPKLEDKEYWLCRIGYIGSVKSSDIRSFHEKGMTTIYMAERLMDETTRQHLRLPFYYKQNIYYLMYWMITNFDRLKARRNISMENKRIRRNECIVNASLGRKINENLNKLIEKKSKSKMNTMDTLLELFNFNSDIIISGMRNLNDVVKGDELVNDLTWLMDISFTAKGPQSLGESSSKMIAAKYRYLDPSMVGIQDLATSSNSDVGMRGSFTPFVQLYDGFYFTPEHEPADAQYNFEKALAKDGFSKRFKGVPFTTFEKYCDWKLNHDPFRDQLDYEIIQIVEREPTPKIEGLAMRLPSELQKENEETPVPEVNPEEKPKRGRRKAVKLVTASAE